MSRGERRPGVLGDEDVAMLIDAFGLGRIAEAYAARGYRLQPVRLPVRTDGLMMVRFVWRLHDFGRTGTARHTIILGAPPAS